MSSSSFIIEPWRRSYLDDYASRMSSDRLDALWDDNVANVLREQGFEIPESPRSIYKVSKLYEALNKYDPGNAPHTDVNNECVRAGIDFARACFAKPMGWPKLEVSDFTPKHVHDVTTNHTGSAGLTFWGVKKKDAETRAYERGLQIIRGQKRPEPCIAFARTQFNDKTRLVWGYPYSMTAIEGLFARPLIEEFKKGITPMAFAMPTYELGGHLRVSSYHKRWAYSLDVKSFDSAASAELIHEAFKILKTWFNLEDHEGVSNVPLSKIWKICRDYFIYTYIVMPDKNVYKGKRSGVPSGSYFTQMIDSIINTIYVGAISYRFNMFVDKKDFLVLGDDVLFWSNRDLGLSDLASFGSKLFGVTFNAEKSSKFRFDQKLHYLGRDWVKGVPTLDLDEILIRMTQPERFRKYPKDKKSREKLVYLIIISYAAVYDDAYAILVQVLGLHRKWYSSQTNMESYIEGLSEVRWENGEAMTGLQRFREKYIYNDEKRNFLEPLAIQSIK